MRYRVLTVLLSVVVTACGGGASDAPSLPLPTTPAPPARAPEPPPAPVPEPPAPPEFAMVTSTPANGAINVARDSVFIATFNAALSSSQSNLANVTLVGPEGNRIPGTPTVTGAELRLAPLTRGLPGAATYTVASPSLITDESGRTFPSPRLGTFTTASQSWGSVATAVATLPYHTGGTQPLVSVDAAGNVMTVWAPSPTASTLQAARMDASTGVWSAATTIYSAEPASLAIVTPNSMVSAPNGDVYVCWTESDTGSATIRVAHYVATSGMWSFLSPFDVAPSDSLAPLGSQLVVDSGGSITGRFQD